MSKPNFPQLIELPVYSVGSSQPQNIQIVNEILGSLGSGYYYNAARLIDLMFKDDRIMGVSNTRILGVLGAPCHILPADESKGAIKARDSVEKHFEEMFPQSQLTALMNWYLYLGFGCAVNVWDDNWMPRLETWHAQWSRYDWESDTYKLITENNGEITIIPEQMTLATPYGYHFGYTRGIVNSIVKPWMARQFAITDWSGYNEIYGKPIRAISVPGSATDKQKNNILRQIAQLGSNSTAVFPELADGTKFDMKLVESTSTGYKTFQDLVIECNKQIAIVLLGQPLTTDGTGSTWSSGKAGESVREDIKESDAKYLSNLLREQVLKPMCKYQFGDPELAPYICWNVKNEEDLSEKTDRIKTIFDNYDKYAEAGVDVAKLLKSLQIPLLGDNELIKPNSIVNSNKFKSVKFNWKK